MKKSLLLIAFLIGISFQLFAQDDVRPFRIGFKAGIPITVGGTIEYVLPVMDNRIGIMADYGGFKLSVVDAEAKYRYWSFGANYYYSSNTVGRGLYAGISYGSSKVAAEFSGLVSIDPTITVQGSGKADLTINQFQLRLGAKTGKGAFYFNPEIGYAIASAPSTIKVEATFTDPFTGATTQETVSEDVPATALIGFMFSLGIGFTF